MCKSQEEKALKIAMMIEVAKSGEYIGYSDFVWHAIAERLGKTYRGVDYSTKTKRELTAKKLEIKRE